MASTNLSVEPISADPVIIDSPSVPETTDVTQSTSNERAIKAEDDLVESVVDLDLDPRRPFDQPVRVIRRGRERDYSPVPRPRFSPAVVDLPSLVNTASLNDLIDEPDTCADTIDGQLTYITNTPFHAQDVEKISWILKIGILDSWVQKPVAQRSANGVTPRHRNVAVEYADSYDDDYPFPRGRGTPIVRLGNALRVFRTDEKRYGTEKVKFVIVVQGKDKMGSLKLVVCHSRQAAAVDIFHEILNHRSIVFVGAVLKDAMVPSLPLEGVNWQRAVKFRRVGSLKEAEDMGEGVVGVIC